MPFVDLFLEILAERLEPIGESWLRTKMREACHPAEAFHLAYEDLPRCVGRRPLALSPFETERLAHAGFEGSMSCWCTDDMARVALLTSAAEGLREAEFGSLLTRIYDRGDNRERQAILRSLPFLPTPEAHLGLAVLACRTHVVPIFEAIACENGYPARQFPDPAFNQMVLKTMFLGLRVPRIVRLKERSTKELARMARDFEEERRAAHRPVPEDIELLLESPGPGANTNEDSTDRKDASANLEERRR